MTRDEATIHFGSQAALARALGIGKSSVNAWTEIPIDRQCQIEVVTNGQLRADRECLQMEEGTTPRAARKGGTVTGRIEETRAGAAAEEFTVPVTGDLAAALRMHADAAGISPEIWLARMAERHVRGLSDVALDEGDFFFKERPCQGLDN